MIRFFATLFALTAIFAPVAMAQTPQQLLMLQGRQDVPSDSTQPVYMDEETGDFVIPTNETTDMIQMDDGSMAPKPMAKTDEEIKATERGVNVFLWSKMNDEQRKKYMEYLVQDRILLSTSDATLITTSSGMQLCEISLNLINNTPRKLKKIFVNYVWGETKTFAEFSDVDPLAQATVKVALAGSVCPAMLKGSDYDVKTCQMDGLTSEQCKMRIAKQ